MDTAFPSHPGSLPKEREQPGLVWRSLDYLRFADRRAWWHALRQRTAWTALPSPPEALAEAHSLPPPIHRDPAERIVLPPPPASRK